MAKGYYREETKGCCIRSRLPVSKKVGLSMLAAGAFIYTFSTSNYFGDFRFSARPQVFQWNPSFKQDHIIHQSDLLFSKDAGFL